MIAIWLLWAGWGCAAAASEPAIGAELGDLSRAFARGRAALADPAPPPEAASGTRAGELITREFSAGEPTPSDAAPTLDLQGPMGHIELRRWPGAEDRVWFRFFPTAGRDEPREGSRRLERLPPPLERLYRLDPPIRLGLAEGDLEYFYQRRRGGTYLLLGLDRAWERGEALQLAGVLAWTDLHFSPGPVAFRRLSRIPSLRAGGVSMISPPGVIDVSDKAFQGERVDAVENRNDSIAVPRFPYLVTHELCHQENWALQGFLSMYLGRNDWHRETGWEGSLFRYHLREGVRPASDYGASWPAEDFADSCALYCFRPETLEAWSKPRYDYIEERVFRGGGCRAPGG